MRPVATALPGSVASPAAAQLPMDAAERARMERELLDLKRRIEAIEARLAATPPAPGPAPAATATAAAPPPAPAVAVADASTTPTPPTPPVETAEARRKPILSDDEPGMGFELASGDNGALTFKGWLLDERLRYLWFVWTQNTSAGEGGQVVVAGNISFTFSKALTVAAGLGALPTTRSTSYNPPNWMRNDNRTMADEYFRGSWTTGIWAFGDITPKLSYFAMLGNNLSQLGVSAAQLDSGLNTFAARLHWKPTTGEFGFANEFGDSSQHQEVATMFGVPVAHSQEDAQGQSNPESFENSQIRQSDGTLVFSPDPFTTGGTVRKVDYDMLSLNAGVKYQGFALEYEHDFRWLSNFQTTGPIPVERLFDHGFQLKASAMLVPTKLQVYGTAAKIWGDYGDPDEYALGVNWYPLGRREFRVASQLLRLNRSPIGYASVPAIVGGQGWVFTTDFLLAF